MNQYNLNHDSICTTIEEDNVEDDNMNRYLWANTLHYTLLYIRLLENSSILSFPD